MAPYPNDGWALMLHLRCEQYRSMPWRNGAGLTREIAREPGTGDDFLWRLSLATIASNGPFSNYAGYRRSVTLIEGGGFQLAIPGQDPLVLDHLGATGLFPGDARAHCTLINGACTDISLMVRDPGTIVAVVRIESAQPHSVPLDAGALKAVFCLRDAPVLVSSDAPMPGGRLRTELELALHDTVLLDRHATTLSVGVPQGASAELLLLTWKVTGHERSPEQA